jgi:excisionase family DNA binding protein
MTSQPSPGATGRRQRPFLNVKEAAMELRLDESTLYRHLREGRFPGVKVGGRYLVPAAVIEALVADAMAAGRCVDIEEWAARWRDERAAAAAADGRYSGEGRR